MSEPLFPPPLNTTTWQLPELAEAILHFALELTESDNISEDHVNGQLVPALALRFSIGKLRQHSGKAMTSQNGVSHVTK